MLRKYRALPPSPFQLIAEVIRLRIGVELGRHLPAAQVVVKKQKKMEIRFQGISICTDRDPFYFLAGKRGGSGQHGASTFSITNMNEWQKIENR